MADDVGAHATPAPYAPPATESDEVLLDVLRRRRPAIRLGRPLPERARSGVRGEYGPDALDGHRLDSIGFGIQALLRGDRPRHPPSRRNRSSRLWACACWWPRTIRSTRPPLRNQLEQLGCTVTVASDGADALSLWPLTQYDALLTDVNMPKLNGYELARCAAPRAPSY